MIRDSLMEYGIHHVGFVVKDLEVSIQSFRDKFGITDFLVYEFEPQKVWSYGKPVNEYKLLIGMLNHNGGCTIELIQPLVGSGLHSDFLDQGFEGFHHVCFSVDRFDYWKERIEEQGMEILFECETEDDAIGFRRGLFTLDTQDHLIYEIKEIPYFRK